MVNICDSVRLPAPGLRSTNSNKKDADVNVVAAGCRASLNQFICSFLFSFFFSLFQWFQRK